jgi:glycosyltransferase involved in cell wall biosynthesis
MKILHIVFNRVGQGSYWRAYHFGRVLAQRGHEVTILATSPNRRASIQTRRVENMLLVETPDLFSGELRSGWDPWNILNRLFWLRQRKFDLVYAIEARPTVIYPALYLHRIRKISLVLGWSDWFGRGGSVEERSNPLVRAILSPIETYFEEHFRLEADGTTVICTTLRDKALGLGVNPESIRLIPDGCDLDSFHFVSVGQARLQSRIPQDEFIIGYVGSIFRGDAELMVKAFDLIASREPSMRLLIVGYCPFNLRKISRYPHAIRQTGPVSAEDLFSYLASCNVFWLPLRDTNANRGRWPHKLNEYLALGRPTVATAVGDVKTLFETEEIGLLCPDQPDALAEQTLKLYADTELRTRMGLRARQVAETHFNWEQLSNELEELYAYAIRRNIRQI